MYVIGILNITITQNNKAYPKCTDFNPQLDKKNRKINEV